MTHPVIPRLEKAVLTEVFSARDLLAARPEMTRYQRDVAADKAWLASDSEEPMSLRWICHHLHVQPADVRRRYREGVSLMTVAYPRGAQNKVQPSYNGYY
jgi:hypothetical protein